MADAGRQIFSFPKPTRQTQGPIQPPAQSSFREGGRQGVKMTIRFNLASTLTMNGAIPLLHYMPSRHGKGQVHLSTVIIITIIIDSLQKTAVRGTSHTLRKVLQCEA